MSSRFWLSLSAFVAYSGSVIANPTGLSRRAFKDAGEEKFCDEVMCIQGEVMGNTIQYTLSSRGFQPTGWMAIGFGEAMKGSPMVIMWPNRDGSFTMSQRKAPYETEPALDPNPPFQASFLPHSSFVQDKLVTMAFSMPLDPSEDRHTKQIIWAFGRTHPEPEVDANLKFHYRWGTTTLILSNASDDGEEATVPDPATTVEHPVEDGIRPEPDALPLLPYQKTIIAHATLSVIGFLILLPAGALVPRYLRAKYPAWVTLHWVVQVLAGGFNIACSFAAAYRAVSRTGAGHFNDVHKRLGALLLALYVAQCLGGALKHRLQISSPAVSRLHVALGLSIIILAFYQTRIGYTSEWTSATGLAQLPAINFIWWTLIIAVPVLYATGIVFPGQKAINLSISRKSDREAVAAESVPLRATEGEDCGDYMETPHLERPSKAE